MIEVPTTIVQRKMLGPESLGKAKVIQWAPIDADPERLISYQFASYPRDQLGLEIALYVHLKTQALLDEEARIAGAYLEKLRAYAAEGEQEMQAPLAHEKGPYL